MPKDNLSILQRVHRNHAMYKDHIAGKSLLKISRQYGLTYERTRQIIKEHNMRQYFVIDYADDFVLYRGSLQDCEKVLEENYAGLMVVGYRDLTPGMIKSLEDLKANNDQKTADTSQLKNSHVWINLDDTRECINCSARWRPSKENDTCSATISTL